MIESVSSEELMTTIFEPKTQTRFLCDIKDKDGKAAFPNYLIRRMHRPWAYLENGKCKWKPIWVEAYDPIVPSMAQAFYHEIISETPRLFDITIRILGPVGDIVELWEIKDATLTEVDFGTLDWSAVPPEGKSCIDHINIRSYYKGGDSVTVKATFTYDFALLEY